ADLAVAENRTDRALAELRGAVGDLRAHKASFGNLDVQAATAHVAHLADRGLCRAVAQGVPAAVFAWAERARALSARPAPVTAPADPVGAEMLAELHHARDALRAGELAGRPDPVLRTRCLALHRQIRQRTWYPPDPHEPASPTPLRDVVAALGDGTLLVYLAAGGDVYALAATAHHRRVQRLGPVGPLHELHRRWRADLDALATGTLPAPLRGAVEAASRGAAERLDDTLLRPLSDLIGEGPLLVAPPARLAALPWPLLPSLRGRPVAVERSPTRWLRVRDAATLPDRPRVTLVAGSGIPPAAAEVGQVGAVWESAHTLTGPAATTAAVREAAARADVLHIAAHGAHEPDNPLFSYLNLVDGRLYGHECGSWARLPRHVVLSACELRAPDTRPGDRASGMPVALLHGGAGSVVAAVAGIGDEAAHTVIPAYHAALRRGLAPAAALAEVGGDAAVPCPLVCFGAGW
ncbi:MAG TPA: CHAT domain-containing protein, partial [Pilimelia sp.]|nr:CHAT domain-containing protein [Pilimelia sp.]